MGKVRDTGGRWGMRRVPGMREHKRKARSLSRVPGAAQHEARKRGMMRCRPGIVTQTAFAKVPGLQRTTPLRLALRRARDTRGGLG